MPIWRTRTGICTTPPACSPCPPVLPVSLRAFDHEWVLFKQNPYAEVARGLAEYWMAPENLRVVIEEGDGRWGPRTKACTILTSETPGVPALAWHARRWTPIPRSGHGNSAAGEVVANNVLARMMHRVLVESWEAEKAVEEAHQKVVEIHARASARVGMVMTEVPRSRS